MGLFDFFRKKQSGSNSKTELSGAPAEKSLEAKNREYKTARDLEVERLNAAYDFNTIEGIRSIPVPCQEVNGNSSTGRVEYYLRGQCFAGHRDAGRFDLAAECIKKAHDLMLVSDMLWGYDSYMSSISWLHSVGRHGEARVEQARVDEHFAKASQKVEDVSLEQSAHLAGRLDTDLVEVVDSGVCCELCAKYRKRIYSLSGESDQFPKFPADFHTDCGLRPYPYVLGISEPSFNCDDLVAYSNRPFVDDRTKEEVDRHVTWRAALDEEAARKARTEQNRQEFFWLQEKLPSLCPKSLGGYSRMKSSNSKAYQKIVEEAAKLGKELH